MRDVDDPSKPLNRRLVLGMRTDVTSYGDTVMRVFDWAATRESRYVCLANVHVTMESYDSPDFRAILNGASLVTPDGKPLVWALRLLGIPEATQVRGPTLIVNVLARAAETGMSVGFFGGTPVVMTGLLKTCEQRFPGLRVAYAFAPPFRPSTIQEDTAIVRAIEASDAGILFVGLGCPKQERWMAAHEGQVRAVMLGVGAAFDFLAGVKPEAPRWMQAVGLEWLFRLGTEPQRLWRRYVYHNPRFVALLLGQYFRSLIHGSPARV